MNVVAQDCVPWVFCTHALLCAVSACPFLIFQLGLLAVLHSRYLERGTLFMSPKSTAELTGGVWSVAKMKVQISRWVSNHSSFVGSALVYAVLSIILALDKMLWFEDLAVVNLNGWLFFCYDLFPWTVVVMTPLMLLGRRSKWLYSPILIAAIIMEAIGWFVRIKFKMLLDGDLVGIILGSSPAEMMWFLGHYWLYGCILAVVLVVLSWSVVKIMKCVRFVTVSSASLTIAVLAVCCFAYAKQIIIRGVKVSDELTSVHLIVDCKRNLSYYKSLVQMNEAPEIPSSVRFDSDLTNGLIGVVVLGESSTRSHWSLYGYQRKTTPCLDGRKDELVVFSDLVSFDGHTEASIRHIFTTSNAENPSMFQFTMSQVLNSVGVKVSLFSNQERWGRFGGIESFAFAKCEPMLFMNEHYDESKFDAVLLDHLHKELECLEDKKCCFLHLKGSHTPAYLNYPNGTGPFEAVGRTRASEFGTALALNHYDNSIWYTDKLLGSIITKLESIGKPAYLIYVSDHGETPSSKGWRTATDRDLWDVPFVVWLSKEFRSEYPNRVKRLEAAKAKHLQSDQLLYGLLDFAGVTGLNVPPEDNFLQDKFRPRNPRLIKSGSRIYSW